MKVAEEKRLVQSQPICKIEQKLIELESKVERNTKRTTAATLDQDSLHTKLQNNLTVEIDAKLVQPLADLQELFYSLKQLNEDIKNKPGRVIALLQTKDSKI